MIQRSNTFTFQDDTLEFEPYDTLEENYIYWFKAYMNDIFSKQSRRLIKDPIKHKELVKSFINCKDIDLMKDIINAMARNGFKGPKTYFTPNIKFYNFLIEYEQNSLMNINSAMFKHFLLEELEGYSFTYKKNIYVSIKNFLTFIEMRNKVSNHPTIAEYSFKLHKDILKVIGKEKKSFAYLTPNDEFYRFLNAIPKTPWKKANKERNSLMLKILLITGIRVGELVNIRLKDIVISKEYNVVDIAIIGKGNKKRKVNIAYNLIAEEIEICISNSQAQGNTFLFATKSGKHINERYLNNIITQVMIVANISPKEKNGPHMLRHSACTWLSAVAGFDIAKLQVYMAHEDITTTKKYTHLDAEVVKDISKKANNILGDKLSNFSID
jgi:integrase/recombinase XerD